MYPYGPFTLGIDCAFALKTRICPDFLRHFFRLFKGIKTPCC